MPGNIRRIAILRALKLGDLLCTVPALRALRAAHPFAEIRLIGLPWAAELVRRYDTFLDGLFVLPGFPGFPERVFEPRAFTRFLDEVQSWEPDLVLQMHGSGELSNPLVMLLGARTTGGYAEPGRYCPDPARFIPYPADLPEVGRHLRLMEHLGMPSRGMHKELPVYDADRRALTDLVGWERGHPGRPGVPGWGGQDGLAPSQGLDGPYVVVHPGASVPEHRWPPDRFAAVADHLAGQGLQIVLTGGAEEAPVTLSVQRQMRAPAINLTGRTSLGTLAALLERAALLVSNDTGVMHVGESVGTPLVAVSFDSESWRWAPQDAERYRLLPGGMAVSTADVLEVTTRQLCSRTAISDDAVSPVGRTPDGRVGPAERR
jgi:ADP-heptose:LPS heptosyltransferase